MGLTLSKVRTASKLVGVLFSPRPLSMYIPPAAGPAVVRPRVPASPPASGASLELISGPETVPGEAIQLKGRGLPAGTEVQVQIDNVTMQRAVADRDGTFTATVTAPGQFGFHTVTMIVQGRVVSGLILSIRPGDD
jgi:hypothetical protein